jgi:hypothetical protein
MAIRLTRSFVSTAVPGSYFEQLVRSTPVGIGATGVVTIIGEAEGGESFANEALKENFFSPDQLAQVKNKYISGPIVDAFGALSAPSADTGIQGSVNRIYILKTNSGAKAQATVDTDYGTLRSNNWGKDGNKIKYQVTASQAEVAPEAISGVVPAFGAALDDASFSLRINGGASTVITLSNVPTDHATITDLIIELNTLLPAGITASPGDASNSFKLTIDADPANFRKGFGKTLELIDSTPGDLAKLNLLAGLYRSGAESEIEVSVTRSDIGLNETLEVAGQIALEIGYAGTTATMSISGNTLTTTVTGGSGANLSVDLTQYVTVTDLAAFISSQAGYTANATTASAQMSPRDMDKVTAIGICSTGAGLRPGRVKRSLKNFKDALSTSSAVEFVAIEVEGLPSPMSTGVFLSGGVKGSTTAANYVDALTKLEGIATNFVVPLFSRDASEDILDGLTESGSTYTIDSVHAATKSHVLKMSTPKLKRHRVAMLSYKGTFSQAQAKAASLASFRTYLAFQDVDQVDSQGEIKTYQPWYSATIGAGMQAAGFYKSFTNKLANVISYRDPAGFDSGSPGDVETALLAGLMTLQSATAGVKWVSDQSTYGIDSNFVYNSLQAVYAADVLALDLADSFQTAFVGQSLADVDRATALAFLANKMQIYRQLKLIAASDDAPLGYKNEDVKINGPIMDVKVEIKLATTIFFIPISLEISQVQQSA